MSYKTKLKDKMNIFNDLSGCKMLYRTFVQSPRYTNLSEYTEIPIKRISGSAPILKKVGNFAFGYDFDVTVTTNENLAFIMENNLLVDFVINNGAAKIKIGDGSGFLLSEILPPTLGTCETVYIFRTAKPQVPFIVLEE